MAGRDDTCCTDCGAIMGTWHQQIDRQGQHTWVWQGTYVFRKERILPGTGLVAVPLIGPKERLCRACADKRS